MCAKLRILKLFMTFLTFRIYRCFILQHLKKIKEHHFKNNKMLFDQMVTEFFSLIQKFCTQAIPKRKISCVFASHSQKLKWLFQIFSGTSASFQNQSQILELQSLIKEIMADHKLAQVMESMKANLSGPLSNLAPLAQSKSQDLPQACFNKHENNAQKFAQCITTSQKKLNEVMEQFQFKMFFLNKTAQSCIAKGRDIDECSNLVSQKGKPIIEGIQSQLEKL